MNQTPAQPHVPTLDGVRGVSILAVLITHLFPVRIDGYLWNENLGMFGMALFFVLSGYLITSQLVKRPSVGNFLARRLFRILPLAWLVTAVVSLALSFSVPDVLSHLFFYANLPPQTLRHPIDHFWSLCVEVQFYMLGACLLTVPLIYTRRGLPVLLIAITAFRIGGGIYEGSITWYRVDDLLAGAALALLVNSRHWPRWRKQLASPAAALLFLALLAFGSVTPDPEATNWFSFARPYAAAAFVGALLANPDTRIATWLKSKRLGYIASISYALYVLHLPLAATWLGSGDVLEKYMKRPLLFGVLFALAHISTFQFERRFNEWGRRIGQRFERRRQPLPAG